MEKIQRNVDTVLHKAFHEGEVPDDWQIRVVVLIHKNGDSSRCETIGE